MPPTFDRLEDTCLFCSPEAHGQRDQVILRSDTLYLFAGLGAIADGYVIVTPHRCDRPGAEAAAIAELDDGALDELFFLRALVGRYFTDRYGTPGMSFEHGRAGTCLTRQGTRHCYHGHLCCYPVSHALWTDPRLEGRRSVATDRFFGLRELARGTPYLYVERGEIDATRAHDHVERERWEARVIPIHQQEELESQLLRKVLADRVGRPEAWDWRRFPTEESARALVADLRAWLREPGQAARYVVDWTQDPPVLDLRRSMVASTREGNNYVALRYQRKWGGRIQHGAVGRFLRLLPDTGAAAPRVLDAGCGPGEYARVFAAAGLQTVAVDLAESMVDLARQALAAAGDGRSAAFAQMDVLSPAFRDGSFDGIWLSAVWVHVPRPSTAALLHRLRALLAPGGVMYLSMQTGTGSGVRWEGRVFVYYRDDELRRLFRECGLRVEETWTGEVREGTCGDTRVKHWRHYLVRAAPPASAPAAGAGTGLTALGEREILRHIQRWIAGGAAGHGVVLGAGDDCAVLGLEPGRVLVTTTDHCPTPVVAMLGDDDPWYRGWYSMVISLSDLASMGAAPLGMLLAVEAPREMELAALERFYAGVLEASREFDCPVVGGNLREGPALACVSTALGQAEPARLLRRDAARAGQAVVVVGDLGLFWAAVIHRLLGVEPAPGNRPAERNLVRPVPRLREGRALAERGLVQCAIDGSDGLIAAFHELAEAGGVDLHIDLAGVPAHPAVRAAAEMAAVELDKLLLAWGDWQLVCTCAPGDVDAVAAAAGEFGCPVQRVGWVSRGSGRTWLHTEGGTAPLTGLPNERFTPGSYFLHGLDDYLSMLRETPLCTLPEGNGPP